MGDRDRRPADCEPIECSGDPHLGERVDRRRRLVEDQHVGIGQPGPDQRDQLPLPGGQRLASFADPRRQTVVERVDPVGRAEVGDDRLDLGSLVLSGRAKPMFASDRVVEQERLLRHDHQTSAQFVGIHIDEVDAADGDRSGTSDR